jgi:hypothetical protein
MKVFKPNLPKRGNVTRMSSGVARERTFFQGANSGAHRTELRLRKAAIGWACVGPSAGCRQSLGRGCKCAAPVEPAAESKDLGDYFEYNLKQSVTIGKNHNYEQTGVIAFYEKVIKVKADVAAYLS